MAFVHDLRGSVEDLRTFASQAGGPDFLRIFCRSIGGIQVLLRRQRNLRQQAAIVRVAVYKNLAAAACTPFSVNMLSIEIGPIWRGLSHDVSHFQEGTAVAGSC